MSIARTLQMLAACACLFVGTLWAPAAEAQDVCDGYSKSQRITRLGGPNSFSRGGAYSPSELLELMEKHRVELEKILRDKGFSDEVIAGLYEAVRSGRGLSERKYQRGEVFQWMTWRKNGQPMATGPLCFAATKTYQGYEIDVVVEEPHPGDAKCALKATGDCKNGTIQVDAGGSSAGVEVSMSGPGGTSTVIAAGSGMTRKEVPFDRYAGDVTFTARAEAHGPVTVRTYTFAVPKACLNLAFIGDKTTERAGGGKADTCTATARVDRCPDPTPPSCTLTVDPNRIMAGESVTIDASGHWMRGGLEIEVVDAGGTVVDTYSSVPATATLANAGSYTIRGTAKNEVGKTAECNAVAVTARRPAGDWILRAYGMSIKTEGDTVNTGGTGPVRTHQNFDGGDGFGVGLEYKFSDLIGLEGDVLLGQLESEMIIDVNEDWIETEADLDMLAFLIGPNFHLTRNSSRVDFYLGPYVGMADFDDVTFRGLGQTFDRRLDGEFVWGLKLGLDFLFGDSPWALHIGARYMDATIEVEDRNDVELGEVDIDPLMLGIGFAYRF